MSKHDKIERSRKRGGYRPANGKRSHTAWDAVRLLLSCLLCIVCYPLGLVALWTCRQSVGVKLLLTIVTAILFFMVLGWALTIDTGIPFVTELQKVGQRWLNTLSDTISVEAIRFRQFAEQVSAVYMQFKETLPSLSDVLRHIAEDIRPLEAWLRTGMSDDFDVNDYVTVTAKPVLITPAPVVTAAPSFVTAAPAEPDGALNETAVPAQYDAGEVKPEATQAPELVPTPTPDVDPNTVVYMDKDKAYFHSVENCDNAVGTVPFQRSIAMMRGAKECPVCFAGY